MISTSTSYTYHNETRLPMTTTHDELRDVLYDTSIHAVSVAQAAEILGIARSTASHAIRKTGVLVEGVPVMRVGKRQLVSTTHLRDVLGIAQPLQLPFNES